MAGRRNGFCCICATRSLDEGKRRSVPLKPHGVPGGLPCRTCGNQTQFREYDARKEPSPYARYKVKEKPAKEVRVGRADLAWDDEEED